MPQRSRFAGPFSAVGAPPILVVGTTGDPDVPYQEAVALANTLSSGVLLTFRAEGHASFGRSACATARISSYLVDRRVPAHGTVCTDEPEPSAPAASVPQW